MLPALLALLALAPARAGILYGLTAAQGAAQLCTFDPQTGARTAIGAPALGFAPSLRTAGALDGAANVFYFAAEKAGAPYLVGLSLTRGAVVSALPLPFAALGFVGEGVLAAWAAPLGALALTGETAGGEVLVGLLDAASGNFSERARFPKGAFADDAAAGGATFVPPASLLFDLRLGAEAGAHLFLVDLASGNVSQAADPPPNIIQSHVYDPGSGAVFGSGVSLGAGGAQTRGLFTVDPASLAVACVARLPKWGAALGAVLAVTTESNMFWLAARAAGGGGVYLVQTALADGSEVSVGAQPLCAAAGAADCPFALAYTSLCRRGEGGAVSCNA